MSESTQAYSYSEALEALPPVRAATESAIAQIEALTNRIQSRDELEKRQDELTAAVDRIVETWAERVQEHGGEAKGLWLVDWDSGGGYYCWRFPEGTIGYFHSYEEGFAGRVPIA